MYGERIRHFRKLKRLSQADMANKLHMAAATCSKIETNHTHLYAEQLEKISIILGVTPLSIMNYSIKPGIPEIDAIQTDAGTFLNYQKDLINEIINVMRSEIDSLKQNIENQNQIILHQLATMEKQSTIIEKLSCHHLY